MLIFGLCARYIATDSFSCISLFRKRDSCPTDDLELSIDHSYFCCKCFTTPIHMYVYVCVCY